MSLKGNKDWFSNLVLTAWLIFVILTCLFVAGKANATPNKESYDYCVKLGQTAAIVIMARDGGVPHKDMRDVLPDEIKTLADVVYRHPDLKLEVYPSAVAVQCVKFYYGSI